MLFVKTKDLKKGMRLAKPIYNKKGVLLYGRDTKLTEQGIASIKNFDLIGIYALEPAEPLPPMSDENIEFERFQTMAVFSLKEDMQSIINQNEPKNLTKLIELIMNTYGRQYRKINFAQNLRSPSDYVYKHSLNVAIISALLAGKLNENSNDMREVILVALLHDIGLLRIKDIIACKDDPDSNEKNQIKEAIANGYALMEYFDISSSAKRLMAQVQREIYELGSNVYEGKEKNISLEAKIIITADIYDKLTAMKVDELPTSEFLVIKRLVEDPKVDAKIVKALTECINILSQGVCVELNSGEKGLVIAENSKDLFKPMVLGFSSNRIYDLENSGESLQIKDIMKTMDNRTIIDQKLLAEYL